MTIKQLLLKITTMLDTPVSITIHDDNSGHVYQYCDNIRVFSWGRNDNLSEAIYKAYKEHFNEDNKITL